MTRLVLVLAVVVALVCGVSSASDPTWEFTCSDKPFPLAFYNLAVSPCAYDNATYVNQVGKIPCGTADPAVESNCHRARYTGKPRTSQYGFASTVTSVDGIHAPASVTDQSYQTGICVVGASVTSRLLVTPQDPTEAISTISVSPFIKANSLYVQYLRLIDPSTDAKVAEVQLTTPYASIDYDISVPSGLVSAGKTWALELVSSTSAGKQDICFTDISTFAVTPDVTPGFACGCLEDFTFGSFCAKHSPTDQRKWCHVASDCDGALISERTSRPYKNCDDYPLLSSCQEAVRVDSESARFYGTLENLNNDESRLPETCGFGFKGTRGLWLKALGKNRPIKINTCPISGFPSFSSTAAVFTAQGEVICDSLTCLDSTLFTKQQRFTCGDKIASDLEFFGRKGVWYYIWIGPDGAPFDFIDADSVLYGGNFDVSVIGASEWLDILNPPTEEEVVVRDPIVYSPDKYEIVDGNCRKGYILNVTLNTACGSLDPNCERYIRTCTDIDECADPTLHNCHRYAICTNTAGSFTCKCTDAFVDDGTGTCVEKPSGDLIEIKRQKEIADGIEMSEKLLQDEYGSVESDAALKSLQSRLNYLETTAKENLGYWQALAETASAKRDLAKSFVPLFDTFPNIGFLGRGYDMFLGNPLSEKGVDPGFRLSVIDMVYSGMVSRDGGFSVPDLVDVTREPYAHFDSNAKLITTESEYQSTATSGFKLDVSVGGSYEGASVQLEGSASFSLNKEHQNTLQTISKADSVFVQIVGRSIVYRARLEDKTPEKLSDGFVLFVESLDPSCEYETGTFIPKCVDEEEQKYQQVIELYGTHYTTEVVMGGRAFERYTMDQSDMTNIQSQMASTTTGLSVEASAKISSFSGFLKTEGEISSRFSSSVRNYLKTQNVERKQWYLGGSAGLGDNENGNTESVKRWAATVVENPVPVSTVVAPIPVLLTSKQFPNDPSIDRKRRHLFEVLYNACNRKGGENCGQYLERPTLDESDLTIARFGDFFEVVSKAYPSLPANTQMQLFQGATNQGSSSVEYYPIKITSFTTDPSTGVVSFSDGASFDVKSPFLESSSLQCYCDSTGVTSELVFRFQVANSAGSSKATLSPTFVFQDLAGTVTENADYKEDQLNTDGQSFTKSGDYFAITKGSLTNIKLNLTLTGTTISDVVTIGSFSALWRGQEHSFTGLLTCTSESKDKFCTVTLSNPTVTGSTPYLCSSLENKLTGDASSANACQNSCRNQVIPPPSATACRYYAFFDTLSRCVLADRTDTPTVVQVSGFKGSVSLRCSGTPPASIPDSNKSAAAGNFNVLQFPASKFTKFQILSPFLTYNEARRPIFYGDSFFFASANGGITARSGTTNLLSAEPLVTVDSENKVVYKDASTLNYLTFRILSETVPIGEPVRTTDLDVLFEVKSGFYTIIFNRLSVVLLGVNPSTDRLFPVTVQSPTDLVKGRFRLVAVNGKDLAPSREDLALILGQPQMNVEVLQVQNTWLWITANFSEDVRRPDGGKLRVKDFVAKVSDSPNGGNSITCVLSSYQSTPNERSANIFNMKVDCAPGNVVPGRQLTLTASAYSVGSYPKPVLPTTIEIKDDRPNYYVGRTIFRDDTTTNQLDSQIFFKYHIITDDNQELANRGTTAGGRYSITDSFGRNVDCTVTWNSPTGSILGVSCPNVKKGEEENVVFALLYPCSLRMVLPSSTARLCDDANLQSLAFPLTPYLTAITTAQGVPSTRITIRDGLAKTLDGQIFTPLSATDVTISGPKTQVNFNACTSSAACSKSLASIDIAGVQSGTTTFAINDPCSSQLWSRTLNKYSPLCFDASLQNAFLSQTITLFQQA